MAKLWLGIDLGGTKMLAEVFDEDWKVLGAQKRKTKGVAQEEGLERLVETARDALASAGVKPEQLGGVGIGSPGPLDLRSGTILRTPNLGWVNAPLKTVLEKGLGRPTVVLNDVDAGVYGEARRGAGKGSRSVLGVFPGTGIGGGFVYEDNLLRGEAFSAMEIGHMLAVPNGPRCGCGKRGCLEAVAARLAISAAASTAALRGQAPYLKEHTGTDPAKIRSNALAASVANGDKVVQAIIEDACDHMGRVMGDVINLLAPETVVMGGGLVQAMPELIVKRVAKAAGERVMDSFRSSYTFKAAELGDHATSLGAAAWARKTLGNG